MNKRILIFLFISFIFSQDTIYFVYNAKNDFFSTVSDFFHKSFAPKTYPCRLCDLTYGKFTKKKPWGNFLDSLENDYEFVYKNQVDEYALNINSYPVILIGEKNNIKILISTDEINKMNNLDEMIEEINKKLVEYNKGKN